MKHVSLTLVYRHLLPLMVAVLTLFGAASIFAEPAKSVDSQTELAFQHLLALDHRPSITEVKAAFGDLLSDPSLDRGGSRKLLGYLLSDPIRKHGPRIIAAFEKSYPGATFVGLGRDSAFLTDLLDAFYLSLNQPGRVSILELGRGSFRDNELLSRYLQSKGFHPAQLSQNPAFVVFDATNNKSSSQSRQLLRNLHDQCATTPGCDLQEFSKKVGFINTGYHQGMYRGNLYTEDALLLRSIIATNYDRQDVSELLSLDIPKELTYTLEYHESYGELTRGYGELVRPSRGSMFKDQIRREIIKMQIELIKTVSSSEFFAQVQNEATTRFKYQFPVQRPLTDKEISAIRGFDFPTHKISEWKAYVDSFMTDLSTKRYYADQLPDIDFLIQRMTSAGSDISINDRAYFLAELTKQARFGTFDWDLFIKVLEKLSSHSRLNSSYSQLTAFEKANLTLAMHHYLENTDLGDLYDRLAHRSLSPNKTELDQLIALGLLFQGSPADLIQQQVKWFFDLKLYMNPQATPARKNISSFLEFHTKLYRELSGKEAYEALIDVLKIFLEAAENQTATATYNEILKLTISNSLSELKHSHMGQLAQLLLPQLLAQSKKSDLLLSAFSKAYVQEVSDTELANSAKVYARLFNEGRISQIGYIDALADILQRSRNKITLLTQLNEDLIKERTTGSRLMESNSSITFQYDKHRVVNRVLAFQLGRDLDSNPNSFALAIETFFNSTHADFEKAETQRDFLDLSKVLFDFAEALDGSNHSLKILVPILDSINATSKRLNWNSELRRSYHEQLLKAVKTSSNYNTESHAFREQISILLLESLNKGSLAAAEMVWFWSEAIKQHSSGIFDIFFYCFLDLSPTLSKETYKSIIQKIPNAIDSKSSELVLSRMFLRMTGTQLNVNHFIEDLEYLNAHSSLNEVPKNMAELSAYWLKSAFNVEAKKPPSEIHFPSSREILEHAISYLSQQYAKGRLSRNELEQWTKLTLPLGNGATWVSLEFLNLFYTMIPKNVPGPKITGQEIILASVIAADRSSTTSLKDILFENSTDFSSKDSLVRLLNLLSPAVKNRYAFLDLWTQKNQKRFAADKWKEVLPLVLILEQSKLFPEFILERNFWDLLEDMTSATDLDTQSQEFKDAYLRSAAFRKAWNRDPLRRQLERPGFCKIALSKLGWR